MRDSLLYFEDLTEILDFSFREDAITLILIASPPTEVHREYFQRILVDYFHGVADFREVRLHYIFVEVPPLENVQYETLQRSSMVHNCITDPPEDSIEIHSARPLLSREPTAEVEDKRFQLIRLACDCC